MHNISKENHYQFSMSILPDEIIHNHVLTQLPVKSLLRFKSVCKYWYNLINSPTFLNIYRKYAIESRDYYSSNDLLIVSNRSIFRNYIDRFFTYLYGPQFSRGINATFDKINDESSGTIDVSCNGVICTRRYLGGFVLCNPITRECRQIIKPLCRYKYPMVSFVYGFGYDSVNDNYKIIQIYEFRGMYKIPLGGVVQIYSLRTNSWKEGYKICPSIKDIQRKGISEVNNVLHFICSTRTFPVRYLSIFAIDLHTEKYKCMALPIKLTEVDFEGCTLIASNGHLFFSSMINYTSLRGMIWVMKEYGVVKSWTKLYEVEGDIMQSRIIYYKLSKVKDGELLLIIKPIDVLVWYNLKDKSFRKVDVSGKGLYDENQWVCMKGSLALILGSTDVTQLQV